MKHKDCDVCNGRVLDDKDWKEWKDSDEFEYLQHFKKEHPETFNQMMRSLD